MAASLTIASATVGPDGRTVTIAIGGSSGALTPTTGVTGFLIIAGANQQAQTSATISGTTLTIALSSFIGAGQTVTINTVAGNLTDGAANTMTLATGQAATNSSTKANPTFFAWNNAGIYTTGIAYTTAATFGRTVVTNSDGRFDTVFTGTDLSLSLFAFYANSIVVSVDGGAEVTVTTTATGSAATTGWYEYPLASNLSDGDHRVSFHAVNNTHTFGYLDSAAMLKASGSAPALKAPTRANTSIDPQGTSYLLKSTNTVIADNTAYIVPSDDTLFANPYFQANGYNGVGGVATFTFKATCDTIKAYMRRAAAQNAVDVDGTPNAVLTTATANDLAFDWVTVATGLDSAAEHTYTIGLGKPYQVLAIQTVGGTGINTTSAMPPPVTDAWFGDSISIGYATSSIFTSHMHLISTRSGRGHVYLGVAGATLIGSTSPSGDSTPRINDVLSLAHLDRVTVLYGTNDVNSYYNSGGAPNATYSAAAFYTAYLDMITKLTASGTNNVKIDCWGIFIPGWGTAQDALTPSYNAQIQNAVAALQAAYPAKAANYRYVDTTHFNPVGAGVHPNDAQSVNVADRAMPYAFLTSPGYAVSGPSAATVGTASSPFTLAVAGGGKFNGTETITLSDGGAGGTFTPSIGSASVSPTTVTPVDGASSFTFTYTPAASGSLTLTAANGQSIVAPGGQSVTASATVSFPLAVTMFAATA